jgi:hypothetical protein
MCASWRFRYRELEHEAVGTRRQVRETQTWLRQNPGPMWFNCELMAVRAMRELAEADAAKP